MTKLFTDFKPADYDAWINQIKKDLKDKPLEALESNPEKEISIKAYYHPVQDQFKATQNSLANNFTKESNNWAIRREYPEGSNEEILIDLNEGVDAVGLIANSADQFTKDQNGILFQHIVSDIRFENVDAALTIPVAKESHLNFDIISINAKVGEMKFSMNDFAAFYQKRNQNKTIWVNGFAYGEAGASTIQELAFTLAHLNEYVHALKESGEDLKSINEKIILELSVNDNYFVNLAKFRAIRELIGLLFSGYDSNFKSENPIIYAKTTSRFLAVNDRNNNFIRQTTQAMSAVLGGCYLLTISTLKSSNAEEEILNKRMAKNIQLVLREESYFDKVVDPAAGSMYLENLTDQLIEKAWNLFKEIENKGGLISCLQNNTIQNWIEENQTYLIEKLRSGKQSFLGVNKYPSSLEKWTEVKPAQSKSAASFKALSSFSLESFHQAKTVVS
jgi:methylmalonyl-CoA mutase